MTPSPIDPLHGVSNERRNAIAAALAAPGECVSDIHHDAAESALTLIAIMGRHSDPLLDGLPKGGPMTLDELIVRLVELRKYDLGSGTRLVYATSQTEGATFQVGGVHVGTSSHVVALTDNPVRTPDEPNSEANGA